MYSEASNKETQKSNQAIYNSQTEQNSSRSVNSSNIRRAKMLAPKSVVLKFYCNKFTAYNGVVVARVAFNLSVN